MPFCRILLLLTFVCPFLVSAASARDIAISTASPASIGVPRVSFENDALVAYDPATETAAVDFDLSDAFGLSRNLVAAHRYANGDLLMTTQAGGTIAGVDFNVDDLVLLDVAAGSASVLFDGSALGLERVGSGQVFIDAVFVRPSGSILFSTMTSSTFLGLSFDNDDLVEYDPQGGGSASIFFDGAIIGGDPVAGDDDPDIRGFHIMDDGRYVFAARDGGGSGMMTIAGLTFSRDDLVVYDPVAGTASLYLDGEASFANPGELIDAVTAGVVPEPTTGILLGLGLGCLSRLDRRERQSARAS